MHPNKPAVEAAQPPRAAQWTKQDYEHSIAVGEVVERIVRHIGEAAVRLAITRNELEWDPALELTEDGIVKDVIGVLTGEDSGCDENAECEMEWAEKEVRETLKTYPAVAATQPPTPPSRDEVIEECAQLVEGYHLKEASYFNNSPSPYM